MIRSHVRTSILGLVLLCAAPAQAEPPQYLDRLVEREGVRLHLRVEAIDDEAPVVPQAGQSVRLRLEGIRRADDQPLKNWAVGAWLDREIDAMSGAVPVCGQRVAKFLSGNLLQRPLLDLTGYYVLSLDAEPSVSVLDPSVSFSGRSSLYASMKLQGRGFDWVKTEDDARLFVALPDEHKVAIVDLHTFRVLDHLSLSGRPTRLALQPDERLLWVGQTGTGSTENALEVIDTVIGKAVARVPLPAGHHEFAFSEDGRSAYVSNRQSATLSVMDAGTLTLVRDIPLGFEPLGLMAVPKESSLWIVDAKAGRVHRYDLQGNPRDVLSIEPGLGPGKLTPDGRYVLIVNPSQHRLYVLDAATGRERHRLTISGQPYDVMFSAQYAYVRTLESEQVAMVPLASLSTEHPTLQFIPVGAAGVAATAGLPRASSMTPTLDQAGAFFATPAERTLYHYMEGMNAPDTGLRTYGHTPVAATVIRRGLREVGPGQYSAVIRLPSAGRMVLALASEAPVLRECLGLKVEVSKKVQADAGLALQWMSGTVHTVSVGRPVDFRLRVKDPADIGLAQSSALRLRIVPTHGGGALVWPLEAVRDTPGEWVGSGVLAQSGGYYVHVEGNRPLQSVYATVLVSDR